MPQETGPDDWMGPVSPIPNGSNSSEIGGGANSPGEFDPVAHWEVERAGIDSAVFRFKVTSLEALGVLCAPVPVGNVGKVKLMPGEQPKLTPCDPDTRQKREVEVRSNGSWIMNLGWAQVIAHPDHNLINVDCRPAALLDRDASTSRLLNPAERHRSGAFFGGHRHSILTTRSK